MLLIQKGMTEILDMRRLISNMKILHRAVELIAGSGHYQVLFYVYLTPDIKLKSSISSRLSKPGSALIAGNIDSLLQVQVFDCPNRHDLKLNVTNTMP